MTAEISIDEVARLRFAVGRLQRRLRATEASTSLTPTQISVLFSICLDGPFRPSELAKREDLNPTMLSRVLAHLTDAGLVRRLVDSDDRRAAVVEATAAGRREVARVRRHRNNVLVETLAALSPAEREALSAAIPVLELLAEPSPKRTQAFA